MTKSLGGHSYLSWAGALFCSLILHVLLLLFGHLLSWFDKSTVFVPPQVIQVHLAPLGKKREQTLLPRFQNPPVSSTPAPPSSLSSLPPPVSSPLPSAPSIASLKPPPALSAASKPKPPQKVSPPSLAKTPLQILKEKASQFKEEGIQEGNPHGNHVNEALKDSYEAQLVAWLKENYELPAFFTSKQRQQLQVYIHLWIAQDGEIKKSGIEKPSGYAFFDKSVLAAIKRIGHVGAPPLPLRKQYGKVGVVIRFCPLQCPSS